jgi:urease accessory protein
MMTKTAAKKRTLPVAQTHLKKGDWSGPAEVCLLNYEGRFLRRKRLETVEGRPFIVDLPHTTSLEDGDALALDDGSLVYVRAAEESLLRVGGPDLARLAWHIGNRHTPCQITEDYLLIQNDPVIGHMLEHVGAKLTEVTAPFTPEGGAYGMGRTHSHEHGQTAHDH